MLSIIIPTLNEEKYLPRLLESIKAQDFADYEVFVADACSKDKTREIAEQFGCKVIKGGLPAKARNQGVKYSQGEIALFLDADTYLPEGFLSKALKEFQVRNLDVAAFLLNPIPEEFFAKFFLNLYNYPLKALEQRWAHGAGAGIMVRKSLHFLLGGYNEKMKFCEDHDYIQRAAKVGKFGVIKSTALYIDTRRFKKDGWVATGLKYAAAEINMKLKLPLDEKFYDYKFGHYEDN